MEEYWSLHSWDKKCKDISAALEIPDSVKLKNSQIKQLKYVHENYWKSYLIIDVVGFFEDGSASGYGHLGSNKSKFTVKQIIDIQIIENKKP